MSTRTEGQQSHRDDIRDRVAAWLTRQPSFYYDPDDIQLSQEEPPRWARVHGMEDLATDENTDAGEWPHVIHFTVTWPLGEVDTKLQRRIGARTAEAIQRGQRVVTNYAGGYGMPMAQDAAQDAIVDVLEALEYYGGDAKAALLAATTAWDHDREQL